jgi:Pvc16 N-terminal domain/Carboxypeptidase regulatory-like domain
MIRDLSETLQAILDDAGLEKSFPELAAAQVAFERPSEQFAPSQTTVNLFLFDIRENMELRAKEPIIERRNGAALIRRPPMRVDCSYLLTAWAAGSTGPELVLAEHELLGQAMQVLARYPTIPEEFLQGSLKEQSLPLPLTVGGTNKGEMKDPADFWSALGNKLRPSLIVTATIELQTTEPETAPLATTQRLRVGLRSTASGYSLDENTAEELFRVGGRVTNSAGQPLAGATVAGAGLSAVTDEEGSYVLGGVPGGALGLEVRAGAQSGSFQLVVPAPAGETYDLQMP